MSYKKDEVKRKRQALRSFLQTTPTTTSTPTKNQPNFVQVRNKFHLSIDQQQYTEQNINCNICGIEVPQASSSSKKKICGFCQLIACSQHMRKRRKKKGKWQKICDCCQDKYLYDYFMKLQIKAQQSLAAQQQILYLKSTDYLDKLQHRQSKRRDIAFITAEIQNSYNESIKRLVIQENQLRNFGRLIQADQAVARQLQQYVSIIDNKQKHDYEEDFQILSQEDLRLSTELDTIDKRCTQIQITMQKYQKQVRAAYEQWQKIQYNKKEQEGAINTGQHGQKCQII